MNIVVNEELKAYIDPLSADEHEALERSILAEGCRDALVLWGDLLVDGHNRYGICQKHGVPFETVQAKHFQSMDDVHLWMIDQHLGRRSVSDFQRGVLALRKREIVAARRAKAAQSAAPAAEAAPADDSAEQQALATREALARAARLSSTQVKQIETIQQKAAPEVVAAVKAGEISINAAAAVAQLPAEEQVAAAAAGKDELRQAAKRVRESKKKPREETAEGSAPAAETVDVAALQQRVETLEQENGMLRQQIKALQEMLQEKA
ncbi:plasmid replication/partition related protein [Comamonas antarctica]|uniref:Plasmid replication/partition related protein n=1 Tax=Comamonas antarctica TaxID=2743470 RepID=A0A6N1WZS2_9BURK|nr:plasmid replication/partition related protein [Comamonas antarctica]QKV52507.1 plasmid replication/partition related protein [Comamonas antarctica]